MLERAITTARDQGFRHIEAQASVELGLVQVATGRVEQGLATVHRAVDTYRATGSAHWIEVAALLRVLEGRGEIVQVDKVGWVAPAAVDDLCARVRAWFDRHETLSTGEFKDLTQLTRRAAIPWLEWLDARRITLRQGDHRVAGPDR